MSDRTPDHLLERMLFFSDAVFAIAITLLIIDVHVPELPKGSPTEQYLQELLHLIPSLFGYVLSFLVIARFWITHHVTFAHAPPFDSKLLMAVAFMPFATSLGDAKAIHGAQGLAFRRTRGLAISLAAALALMAGMLPGAAHAAPLRVMILDGESAGSYHEWEKTTPLLREVLRQAGLFQVDVVTAPPAGGDFGGFSPAFEKYGVVVFNYDAPDERWPESLKTSFERYVRRGGGVVLVHAADNAFPGWKDWNLMSGIGGWRGRDEGAGPYWHYEAGRLVAESSPGAAGSHGRRDPFLVTIRARHPITQGLPASFMHRGDELYARLRGPGRRMKVLATAWSDPANAGSGRHEPMLMVIRYGRGRIFHTTLGHDVAAMSSVDFVATLQRGTEWAATGRVTQRVPDDFPDAGSVRIRQELAAP